jgi:hypothetical protein
MVKIARQFQVASAFTHSTGDALDSQEAEVGRWRFGAGRGWFRVESRKSRAKTKRKEGFRKYRAN